MSSESASRASTYQKIVIRNSKDKEANLAGKVVSFNYFESVYSPEITANLIFVDASGSIKADKAQDTQERSGSIKSSLPIIGDEDLEFIINSKSGTLDFSRKNRPLRVISAPVVTEESNRQSVFLSLVSNATIDNLEIKNPTITYKGRISSTVKKIMKELKIKNRSIDRTRNSYDFISRSKGGLDLIIGLCRKSIPIKGDPGFFFYETQDGHNFKAIDNLISEEPVETYTYSGGLKSNLDNDENDFKIVRHKVLKDQNIKERKKWMSSRNIFFNPATLEVEEKFYTLKGAEGGEGTKVNTTLGKDIAYNKGTSSTYSKTNYLTLDIGSLDYQNLTPNNDPREWQAKSPMRYNLLHSQLLEIQVPCNVKLKAGNVIKVEIERQGDDKELGGLDEHLSGKYLILHLCHHFDSKRSFTSMTIARDTYGLHVKDKYEGISSI